MFLIEILTGLVPCSAYYGSEQLTRKVSSNIKAVRLPAHRPLFFGLRLARWVVLGVYAVRINHTAGNTANRISHPATV
jgi:hypothetical protein